MRRNSGLAWNAGFMEWEFAGRSDNPPPWDPVITDFDNFLRDQHLAMCDRACDILRVKPLVESNRYVDRLHDGGRALGKASAPHAVRGAAGRV